MEGSMKWILGKCATQARGSRIRIRIKMKMRTSVGDTAVPVL